MGEVKQEALELITERCVFRAWVKGAIPYLTGFMDYDEARIAATELGYKVAEYETLNLITTSGLSQVVKQLTDDEATGITYCALGSSDTAVAITDTTLGTEVTRKAITTRTDSVATAEFSTFFTAAEATYAIEEIALFAGASATTSADSGRMWNHWLQSYDNSTGGFDLTIDVTITADRV